MHIFVMHWLRTFICVIIKLVTKEKYSGQNFNMSDKWLFGLCENVESISGFRFVKFEQFRINFAQFD